jgi:hypothetical protein
MGFSGALPVADGSIFIDLLPYIVSIISIVVIGIIFIFILRRRLIARSHLRGGKDSMITLLITIPQFRNQEDAKKHDEASKVKEQIGVAESLYAAIGGLRPHHGFTAWFFGRSDAVAFEMVAHEKLVSFYVTVSKSMREFVEQQLHAQWSDAQFEEVTDYNIFAPQGTILGGYLTLKRRNVFPIKTYKDLESDPLNALTNALSKVGENDGIAVQCIVRSAGGDWRDQGSRIVRAMYEGKSLQEAEHGKSGFGSIGDWTKSKESREKDEQKRRDRKLTQAEQKLAEGIEKKISKAGMEVNIRIVACGATPEIAQAYLNNALSAFNQFNVYEYGNSFSTSIPRSKDGLVKDFIYRKFSEKYSVILNTEEMSGLWHMPLPSTETPNIRWMMARIAPAPLSIAAEGLRLGFNKYRGKETPVFMSDSDRRRHMYIMGKTGSGKSEFIKQMIAQDIANGRGLAVIDPHGDLADGALELVPKDRIDDVIYFNPSDTERPFGLNMMEYDGNFPEQKTFVVNELLAIFDQLYDLKTTGGPMFEQYMRNAMLLLMDDANAGATLLEISKVLSDEDYRKAQLAKCKSRVVVDFWEKEAQKAGGDASLANMVPYITSKLTSFITNDIMRPIITQSQSSINFRDILDTGKILIVNLNKGKLGEINAGLIGMIIVSKLQIAAFARADMAEKERKDFYLYIDEFQNFVTPSIAVILSEARKYRLSLIIAHQYMAQLSPRGDTKIRDAVLGNVGSLFIARCGPDDTEILQKIFEPTFSAYDLMNTGALTWSAKMIVRGAQEKPFTLTVDPMVRGSKEMADGLKQISRLMYGRDREEVEEEVYRRSGMAALKI